MKTTTYLFADGVVTVEVANKIAPDYVGAINLLRECATKTECDGEGWDILVHAAQYLKALAPAEVIKAAAKAEVLRRNNNRRRARNRAMKDLGLTRVVGALGGVYYE
jgi:hypothetical protein